MATKILIGADIVPTRSNEEFFKSGEMNQIIDENLLEELASVDYRIFNLEVPLTNSLAPIKKCGPNLIASSECIKGIHNLNINFVTLANNHIMDQNEQGLWSTIKELKENSIFYAGVGKNIEEASKPFIITLDDLQIGIYCCAEHEFSIAGKNNPGANPFDALESVDHIAQLKNQSDYVIVLYHGGKELYQYPSPELQKRCRKMIDKGADLVICQHSHCIGCEDKWNGGTIVYGQGNFLFDYSTNELWKTGILIELLFNSDGKRNIAYCPIVKQDNGVSLAQGKQKAEILEEFGKRSENILKEDFVEQNYNSFAESQISGYMASNEFFLRKTFIKGLDKLTRQNLRKSYTRRKIDKMRELILNQYECEAHSELVIQGLKGWKSERKGS